MLKSNKKPKKIYLDHAASFEANPSSIHSMGVEVKTKLQNSRREVADVLGARSEEIIFTSGGTESNNLAIQGVALSLLRRGGGERFKLPHLITTNIEHPSVLKTFELLKKRKLAEITIVPVEENGIVDPKKIKKAIKKNTVLVSVMYANNEIGTIQPIKEIAKTIRHHNKKNMKRQSFLRSSDLRVPVPARQFKNFPFHIFFHTDAVQAVNYLDLNVEKLGVDLLSLSGSKIEGAGRVGILYKRKIVKLANVFGGGDQEFGLRPGTENLPEIIKFSKALKSVQKNKEKETKRLTILRNYFLNLLRHTYKLQFVGMLFNGDLQNRLPNNVNITFPKIPSDLLVIELSEKGIMASAKSACESSSAEGSYVIQAIRQVQGKTLNDKIGGVRFSMGRKTTKKDIDYTVKTLAQILQKLKKWY